MTAQRVFTAPILLPADPTLALQSATKQYADLKAPLASPTFTGTATFAKMVQAPVALTDATTVLVDASLGNTFRLTLTATGHTMGNPSNSTDGQMILFEITSGGAFTFAWGTNYAWGADVGVPTLTQASAKVDYVGFIYNSTAGKWRGLAVAKGY